MVPVYVQHTGSSPEEGRPMIRGKSFRAPHEPEHHHSPRPVTPRTDKQKAELRDFVASLPLGDAVPEGPGAPDAAASVQGSDAKSVAEHDRINIKRSIAALEVRHCGAELRLGLCGNAGGGDVDRRRACSSQLILSLFSLIVLLSVAWLKAQRVISSRVCE